LEEIDLLLVTHFHLDHAGALPYFTEKTGFKGRIFMTHPTKAVLKMMISDSIRVGYDDTSLYNEEEMDRCFRKIEIIDFNQTLEVDGIKFTCYNAGHVLGGAMFSVEIAGVNVLYTGDYSLEDDRHLMAAQIPNSKKTDVLIVESTFGLAEHEDAKRREQRFLSHVEKVLKRGGRLLIPVFALGRAVSVCVVVYKSFVFVDYQRKYYFTQSYIILTHSWTLSWTLFLSFFFLFLSFLLYQKNTARIIINAGGALA